jgi:hypothetical protein
MSKSAHKRYLTRREQAARYSKSTKTIQRWGQDASMAMPPEYSFRGKPHREESELEEWERTRVGATAAA